MDCISDYSTIANIILESVIGGWHRLSLSEEVVILTVLGMKSAPLRTAEVVQGLRSLMRTARAEKGFINGRLYLDIDDRNSVWYEERWRNREDFEEQVRSPRFTRLLALMESASEPPVIEFHFVSETRNLDLVRAVRETR